MADFSYITLNDPLATGGTYAYGINNKDKIVGKYVEGSVSYGFIYSNGHYKTLNDPLATGGTEARGINDHGQIVGDYTDNTGAHGFLYSHGHYTALNDPLSWRNLCLWHQRSRPNRRIFRRGRRLSRL
jgi:probable HAF family extracellular repeat protein